MEPEPIHRISTNTKTTRIAIDTIFFYMDAYSGITRVWETILQHLELDSSKEIILLIRGDAISSNILKSNFHTKYSRIHIKDFNYQQMVQDVDMLDTICRENHIDWFISTYYTYCTVVPNILLIHDMIPEIFKIPMSPMWKQKDLAIRNASRFIVISETSARDLLKFYPHIKTEKYPLQVIHNSIPSDTLRDSNTSRNSGGNNNCGSSDSDKKILGNLGLIPGKYIMTMGSNNEKYKNWNLINSFIKKYLDVMRKMLGASNPFVIIKKNTKSMITSDGLVILSNITDDMLEGLYRNARAFINPSLYEGFGLPIFEAMRAGIPIIAMDIPIYQELCPGAITLCENDADDLWNKIQVVCKGGTKIQKRVDAGFEMLKKYTLDKQIEAYSKYFNELQSITNSRGDVSSTFINLIIQSYDEPMLERRAELEYCILANLENPYVRWIHDFGNGEWLPASITKHPKYIRICASKDNTPNNNWLTYTRAFEYSNTNLDKGAYWGIINADIFLDNSSNCNWSLCRGWLNTRYILAQSRHEFPGVSNTADADSGVGAARMDSNFAKMLHANTQDGWFYMAPITIANAEFELGMLGCDNAIADRLNKSGYKVINMPVKWKIMHYDIAKGKTSANFLEKHAQEQTLKENKGTKPQNSHPERTGQYLVPNYDALMGANGDIDLMAIIHQLGGISNLEKYKVICDLFSSRVIIYNP